MPNLKDITELPVVDKATDGLFLLANDNGAAKQIDPKYIPGSVPDWNQNNPSAPDYVKNRTHYVENAEVVCEVPAYEMKPLINFPYFDVGDTVTIKVNGVEYSVVAYTVGTVACIGDDPDKLLTGAGQYGFTIINDVYNSNGIVARSGAEPYIISWTVDKIHPLDPKYLPCDLMFNVGCTGGAHPKFNPVSMTKPTIVSGSLEAVLEKLANGEIPVVKVRYMGVWNKTISSPLAYGGEFTCDTQLYNTTVIFTHEIPSLREKLSVQISMSTDDPNFMEMLVSYFATSPSIVEIN